MSKLGRRQSCTWHLCVHPLVPAVSMLSQQVRKACCGAVSPLEGSRQGWGCLLQTSLGPCTPPRCSILTHRARREPGPESLLIPTKPLKASENVLIPHQERPKTSSDFHEKPKTLPDGLPWWQTRWAWEGGPRPAQHGSGAGWEPPAPVERSHGRDRALNSLFCHNFPQHK